MLVSLSPVYFLTQHILSFNIIRSITIFFLLMSYSLTFCVFILFGMFSSWLEVVTPSDVDGTVNERLHNVDHSKRSTTHVHTDGHTLVA